MFREEPGVDGSTRWEVMGQDRVQQGTVEGLEEAGVYSSGTGWMTVCVYMVAGARRGKRGIKDDS